MEQHYQQKQQQQRTPSHRMVMMANFCCDTTRGIIRQRRGATTTTGMGDEWLKWAQSNGVGDNSDHSSGYSLRVLSPCVCCNEVGRWAHCSNENHGDDGCMMFNRTFFTNKPLLTSNWGIHSNSSSSSSNGHHGHWITELSSIKTCGCAVVVLIDIRRIRMG